MLSWPANFRKGWYPIGSHHLKVTLKPGESKSYIFLLGYVENPKDDKWESLGVVRKAPALAMIDRYDTTAKVNAAFEELKKYWTELLARFTVHSSTAWSISGTSTSAWLRSTCPVPLPIMNPESAAAWASVIPVRTS